MVNTACIWMRESWMVGPGKCLYSLRHTRLQRKKVSGGSSDGACVWEEEDEEWGADRMQNVVTL